MVGGKQLVLVVLFLALLLGSALAQPVTGLFDAQVVRDNVPKNMRADSQRQASITLRNTGQAPWSGREGFSLRAPYPSSVLWGVSELPLGPNEVVQPGQLKKFVFRITAPSFSGSYQFNWRMFQQQFGFFGQPSENSIKVKRGISDALQSIPGTLVGCGGVFANRTDLVYNYTHVRDGIRNQSQHQNWTAVPNGNGSCGPTAVGMGIDYWNRNVSSLSRNMSIFNVTDQLHRLMNTTANGTTLRDLVNGTTAWINGSGKARNLTVTVYASNGTKNYTGQFNGVNTTVMNNSNVSFGEIFHEFATKDEFIVLNAKNHYVVVFAIDQNVNSNGNHNIALVDPWTGEVTETELNDETNEICTNYDSNGNCIEWSRIDAIMTISLAS